jgi:hypothetical protein
MNIEFFSKYPKIRYDLYGNNSSIELTDICRAVALNDLLLPDSVHNYTYYTIFDGDRPDVISNKLYGTSKYYWTFFVINENLRTGLNSSWPLSYRDFTKYIDKNYAKYSCISFTPTSNINGNNILDLSIIPFDKKYLKYLKLATFGNSNYKTASIAGFDSDRHQLVVYDIHGIYNGERYEIAKDSFVYDSKQHKNEIYTLTWDLPDSTASDYNDSLALKEEWMMTIYDFIKNPGVDYFGWKNHLEYYQTIEQYIFGKMLIPASNAFRWTNYADAAHTYYYANSDKMRSAFDILRDDEIVEPSYMTFYEHETSINEKNKEIKVIRPDYITDFSRLYFEILNNE